MYANQNDTVQKVNGIEEKRDMVLCPCVDKINFGLSQIILFGFQKEHAAKMVVFALTSLICPVTGVDRLKRE